jgi:predicted small secreted protein|tara:strand:- start:1358 stop:1522 length:165 start_codon:yes stop_codon:yes gene_type:complete
MNTNESKNPARIVRTALLALAGAAALFLSACNTVEGVGEDLQESSRNVKDAMSD